MIPTPPPTPLVSNPPFSRTVVCMKWGTLYTAEYVNVLFHACQHFITGDFRFVCFTDDPKGLDNKIIHAPILDIGLRHQDYYHGAWPKLTVFANHHGLLEGRCLFIDLDTIILQSIDLFFEQKGSLVAINWTPWRIKDGIQRTMSSIFAFNANELDYLISKLQNNRDQLIEKYQLEQDYLHGEVQDIHYWSERWLVSFKYHLRQPLIVDRFCSPKLPPSDAKALIFHGRPRPIQLIYPPKGNWDLFPHYGSGVVPWMRDYWEKFK